MRRAPRRFFPPHGAGVPLSPDDFIFPVFVIEGQNLSIGASMPGVSRLSLIA
jgi:delta-aminolevulinic acid dehydratase/porphobilinogen synthase